MGAKLLTVTIASLILILFIDFFTVWYAGFLRRWMPNNRIRVLFLASLFGQFWRSFFGAHFILIICLKSSVPIIFSLFFLFTVFVGSLASN